jgi:hypothetical protein
VLRPNDLALEQLDAVLFREDPGRGHPVILLISLYRILTRAIEVRCAIFDTASRPTPPDFARPEREHGGEPLTPERVLAVRVLEVEFSRVQ